MLTANIADLCFTCTNKILLYKPLSNLKPAIPCIKAELIYGITGLIPIEVEKILKENLIYSVTVKSDFRVQMYILFELFQGAK